MPDEQQTTTTPEFIDPFIVADEPEPLPAVQEKVAPVVEATDDQDFSQLPDLPPEQEAHFMDPKNIPPELRGIHKAMNKRFHDSRVELKAAKEKAALADRFYSDRDFAFQTLNAWANQNGFTVSKAGVVTQTQATPTNTAQDIDPQYLEVAKAKLGPEMEWMAPQMAGMMMEVAKLAMKPLEDQRQKEEADRAAKTQSELLAEYEAQVAQLAEEAPDWDEHEAAMDDLLKFLRGPTLTHKKFGSKLALLHRIVTGDASATVNAAKRMQEAAKNRTPTSTVRSRTTDNIADRVRSAKNSTEAWEIAAASALNGTNAA